MPEVALMLGFERFVNAADLAGGGNKTTLIV